MVFEEIKIKYLYKKIKRKIYKWFCEFPASKIVYFLSVNKNRIIFDNFGGKGFDDNPKYIAEALHSLNDNYELIWLVDNYSIFDFPDFIHPVKIDSLKALYYRATSKVWIDNVRHFHPVKKKKNQIYLQTWHAPYGPKKSEADAEELLSKKYVKEAKYDGRIINAVVSNSKLLDDFYYNSFWLNRDAEILKFGLPRNDSLYKIYALKGNRELFLDKYELKKDCLYILYAPTFRDNYSIDGYLKDFESILIKFEDKFRSEVKIIVKLHPNVLDQSDRFIFNDFILDGRKFDNLNDLIILSDILITDYSSIMFDFSVFYKPVFIYAFDLDEFKKNRGLQDTFYNLPFPISTTKKELESNISEFEKFVYEKHVCEYLRKFPIYDDGNSSIKIAKWLQSKIER